MSDSRAIRGRRDAAPKTSEGEGWSTATWIERLGRGGGRLPPGRHTAITRTLYSYANYQSWAEKVRSSWDPAPADEAEPTPAPKKP